MRESPALDVMGLLHAKGRDRVVRGSVRAALHGREWPGDTTSRLSTLTSRSRSRQYDCVAIVTDHKAFDYDAIVAEADIVVDTRNAIKQRHPHVFRLGAPHPEAEAANALTA